MSDFAAELKPLRLRAGLSQSQLADKLGVSVESVKSWEQGRREPPKVAPMTQAEILGLLKGKKQQTA